MGPHDEETERYLKEFQPQAIRELQFAPEAGTLFWRRLAAGVGAAACAGGLFWFSLRESSRRKEGAAQAHKTAVAGQQRHLSTLRLTSLALEDERKFDAFLDEESRKSLPRLEEEDSTLKVLAKD
jgi:hypothetical protein